MELHGLTAPVRQRQRMVRTCHSRTLRAGRLLDQYTQVTAFGQKEEHNAYHRPRSRERGSVMRHRIAEYEEDFLESGTRAVCACGWKTRRCRDDQEARKAFAAHENETAPTPADQGAARGAIKEMEANDAH